MSLQVKHHKCPVPELNGKTLAQVTKIIDLDGDERVTLREMLLALNTYARVRDELTSVLDVLWMRVDPRQTGKIKAF